MNLVELQSLYDFKDCRVLLTGGTGVLATKSPHAMMNKNLPERFL
jgi:hypothetical protein